VYWVHWFIFKSDSKDRYRWCFSSISQETFFVIVYTDPAILHYIVFIICQFPLTRISLVRFVSRSLVLRSQRAFIEENGKLKTRAWVWAIKAILQTCLRPTWLTFYNGSGSSSFGHKIGCGSTWRPHTKIRKVGPTPTIVLSGVNNTLNLAEKANLSQRRRNALFQPTLIQWNILYTPTPLWKSILARPPHFTTPPFLPQNCNF